MMKLSEIMVFSEASDGKQLFYPIKLAIDVITGFTVLLIVFMKVSLSLMTMVSSTVS